MMPWLEEAYRLERQGMPYALVTIIERKGSAPRDVGAKMLVTADRFFGTVGGGNLEKIALEDARQALVEATSGTKSYPLCFRTGQCCGGAVETLIEVYGCGPHLFLFGGGHVGQALCRTLIGTPFRVTLIEERTEWRDHPELPSAVQRSTTTGSDFVQSASYSKHSTYAIVMTHDHGLDLDVISALLDKPMRYLGLIGSETKAQRFRSRLLNQGVEADLVDRIHCPIGHKRHGKTPQEIAINIASTLLDIHYADQS